MDEDEFNLDTLSDDKKKMLKELKKRFSGYTQPYVQDEYFLLDWLIARKYDVNAAEEMLKNHLKFRKALNQDDPDYRNFPRAELAHKYYPHGTLGFDKHGRPMCYCAFGTIDNKGLICNVKTSDLLRSMFWHQEYWKWHCQDASKKFGKRIHQTNCVMDLKGLSSKHLWKPGIQMFQIITQTLQLHCPEIVHKFYIINAPSLFPTIYNLIKPVLDINVQNKLNVFGENFQEALLKDVDEDQLPVYYGGTLVDSNGDPKCSEHICYGGDVPLEFYYKRPQETEPDLTEVTIANGKQMLIACKISKIGSVIKWYFEFDPYYETYDIGFALYRKLNDQPAPVKDMEMVVPYFRLFCGFVPESGEFIAQQVGTYVVQFDNSYSWINSKRLKYKILVDDELIKQ